MTEWNVYVFCLDPARKRKIQPVAALSEEQAKAIAEKKAYDLFGKKGEGWKKIEIHMANRT